MNQKVALLSGLILLLAVLASVLWYIQSRRLSESTSIESSTSADTNQRFELVNQDNRYTVEWGNQAELSRWAESLGLFVPDGVVVADGRPIEKVSVNRIRLVYTPKPQMLQVATGSKLGKSSYGIALSQGVLELRFYYQDDQINPEGFEGLVNLELLRVLVDSSVSTRTNKVQIVNQQIPIFRNQPETRLVKVRLP